MFVTMPQFEQAEMSKMAGEGQKYWRAVTAAFPIEPWYLFAYVGQVADTRVNLTMLVAWEESLLDVIDLVPPQDRRHVYRVQCNRADGLTIREVRALWTPSPEESGDGVGAVLQLLGESQLLDPRLRPVSQDKPRRLVFRAFEDSRPGADCTGPGTPTQPQQL
jgi:hypothetical protein